MEEKRRFETRINQLEEELEDEQNNSEQLMEKFKKLQFDLEKVTSDLHVEKSSVSKAENAKIMLEKQNRELRDKLTELEELAKGRSKVVISNLEAKIECEAEDHARVQEDGQTLERLAVADRGREKIERKL